MKYTKDNPKFITNFDEIKLLHKNDSFKYICKQCGKEYQVNSYRSYRINNYKDMLCLSCFRSNFRRDHPEIVEKSMETIRKNHGGLHNTQTAEGRKELSDRAKAHPEWLQKSFETNRNNHGGILACQTDEFRKTMSELSRQHPEWQQKSIETNKTNHGGVLACQLDKYKSDMSEMAKSHPEWVESALESNRKNHGGLLACQTDEFKEMMRDLNKSHPEWVDKSLNSNRNNHGGVLALETDEWKSNVEKQCLEKYGEAHPFSYGSNNFEKMMIERYGAKSFPETESFKEFMHNLIKDNPEKFGRKTHLYDSEEFDSSWELAYWIYCKDHNIAIKRGSESIKYTDPKDGSVHDYYADFVIGDNGLLEIKGDHFFKDSNPSTNIMINPYDESLNDRYEAKHKCMIENNVTLITSLNIDTYLNYVYSAYGKDYMNQFLLSNPDNLCYGYTPYNTDQTEKYQKPISSGLTPFDIA